MERRGTEGRRRRRWREKGEGKDELLGALGFLNPRIAGYYSPDTSDRSVKWTLEAVSEEQG